MFSRVWGTYPSILLTFLPTYQLDLHALFFFYLSLSYASIVKRGVYRVMTD